MGAIAAGIIGLAFLIMNLQPSSRVVLLPDADGKVGSIVVATDTNQQLLGTAYGSASVNASGVINVQVENSAEVLRRYAATLDARPQLPVSFTVHFEFGSSVEVTPAFKQVLADLMAALPHYPAPEITVIGHTDRVGTLEANDALSIQRAQTVRHLLVQAGIQSDIIGVSGRGEREPVAATDDEVSEAKNRRVEVNLR